MRVEPESDVRTALDRVAKAYFVPRGVPLPLCELEQHWRRRTDPTPDGSVYVGLAWYESAERDVVAPWAGFITRTPALQLAPLWHRPDTLAGAWIEVGPHPLGRRWVLGADGTVTGGPVVAKIARWSAHGQGQIVYRDRQGAILRRLDYRRDGDLVIVVGPSGFTSSWTRGR